MIILTIENSSEGVRNFVKINKRHANFSLRDAIGSKTKRSTCRNIPDCKGRLTSVLLRAAKLSNNPPHRSLLRLARQVYICANTYLLLSIDLVRLAHVRRTPARMMYTMIVPLIRAQMTRPALFAPCKPSQCACPPRRFDVRTRGCGVNIPDEIRVENHPCE